MSGPADTCEIESAAWAEAMLRRQAELLAQLAEAGTRMALAIEASAAGTGPDKPAAMAFARMTRAVRMTALLQTRLIHEIGRIQANRRIDAARLRREADHADEVARALADPAHDHKARVERIVERIAAAECGDDDDRLDTLVAECGERLDDDDIYGDVANRSVRELVQLICQDLDLDERPFLHERWGQEDSGHGEVRPPPFAAADGGGGVSSVIAGGDYANAAERVVEGARFIHQPFHSSS